ncbi:cytochrome c family protein [Bordetella holmesii 30539]|uniref:Cytochrome C n=2 Tax=Bordetella holmesii TaxID=35814 RepID=A0A158M3J4_9BORD|nr:cytochrome c family protein [Bordetella holmesii ATCC 51541]AMD44181.1 cytochrome [Bordetella holmesii H558]AOB36291.1 cytochrome [Bordetella holmesii]EWM48312.1 cytochrome c family protein [Bordetella holmesii 41130]EWM49600.1 cytochrome c family protein [Bordetella holmesii 35009]EXF90412.1 cytochrome c family protein [Bordetella holmesii 30539]EXX94773.1 cytochrome c family protein [Bordetella holmesii 1058]KAK85106.1 cytochrome C [Bordetella holmesii CDC-H809-BH]KAK87197.1 cytochrome
MKKKFSFRIQPYKSHYEVANFDDAHGFRAGSIGVLCDRRSGGRAADAAPVGNAQNARDKVSMCIGCHGIPGYKASFPELYHVPMIAGQNAKYIEAALNEYRKGARSHPTMDAVAGSLSDQDIADLAAYYSSLK